MLRCAFGKRLPWKQFSSVLQIGVVHWDSMWLPAVLQVRQFLLERERKLQALQRNRMANFLKTPAHNHSRGSQGLSS